MATMSVAERRKYREQQKKKKQGYAVGSPSIPVIAVVPPTRPGSSPVQGSPQPNAQLSVQVAVDSSIPRPPPFHNPPPSKRPKVGPSYEFGLPFQGEPLTNVAWKEVLKVQKRVHGRPDSPERLDREVEVLKQDKKRLLDELEQAKKDWEAAQLELSTCNEMLSGVAAHFPKLAVDASLAVAVEELKESIAENFEGGFKLTIEQMRVLYPDIDESQFDAYKVVGNGRIVEEEEEPNATTTETPAAVPQPAIDIAAAGEFLLNNEGMEEGGDGGHDEDDHK